MKNPMHIDECNCLDCLHPNHIVDDVPCNTPCDVASIIDDDLDNVYDNDHALIDALVNDPTNIYCDCSSPKFCNHLDKPIECINNSPTIIAIFDGNINDDESSKITIWNGFVQIIDNHWGNPSNDAFHDSLEHPNTCQFTIDMHDWMVVHVMPSWMNGPIDGTWFNAPHCKHCGSMGGWDAIDSNQCGDCGYPNDDGGK